MNPILDQTKQAIMQKADPRLKPIIQKLVSAGEQFMYGEKSRDMLIQQLGDGTDPEMIGAGVAKLMGVLFNQSGGKAPMEAMIPAAVVLLCEGLQFIEDGGGQPVTPDFLAECTQAMASSVLQLFGATPDQIQQYMGKAQQMPDGTVPPGTPGAQPAPAGAGIIGGATQGGV